MNHPVVWFEVLGRDGAKLQQFYGDLFKWDIKPQGPVGYGMVEPHAPKGIPGGVGGVFEGTRPWVTFYVETPDLAGTLAQAESAGGKVVMPPKKMPGGPSMAMFQDPEGNVIGLVEAMPPS